MTAKHTIVVVGAGITGLMAAAQLATSDDADRLRVIVIDAGEQPAIGPSDDVTLRVSAISIGSVEILDAVGAWQRIAPDRLSAYDRMRVWDHADEPEGPATLRFDADEFGVPHLGYIVENIRLRAALLEVLDATAAELKFAAPIASIDIAGGKQCVNLDGGESLTADLIIGADGAKSVVRNSVGIAVAAHRFEQQAFVTHLRPAKPHAATAWQRFLADGPLGILPLADGRVSVVWSTTSPNVERAMACNDAELGRLLTDASDAVLGSLTAAGPRAAFPLLAQHAENYVMRGVALIGDAAHTVHPLAGQGANLGLADASALADVLLKALAVGETIGDRPVLRRYERMRKAENATMMHFLTGLNRLFASDSALLGELRRAGMALFNRSGPIRRHVAGVALGSGRR